MADPAPLPCRYCPDHVDYLRAHPGVPSVVCGDCGAVVVRPPRPPRTDRVYLADPAVEPPRRDPLQRQRPAPEDREAAHVRVLLHALRPDCPDPLRPPPKALTAVPTVKIRDPQAGWGDVPASLEGGGVGGGEDPRAAQLGEVLDRLAELPPDARAVCTWLRERAEFETLRGLYVDVGLAFADAAQAELWARDLTARRDGAHAHGRTLVLEAARAWGLPSL